MLPLPVQAGGMLRPRGRPAHHIWPPDAGAVFWPARLLPLLALCSVFVLACSVPGSTTAAPGTSGSSNAGPAGSSGGVSARVAVVEPATVVPTATALPTPTPAPTPIPEPHDYAVAGGGHFFAITGHAVRDEPGGPRFWTEWQRLGGRAAVGLPLSQPYDAADGRRAQQFEQGWLAGSKGTLALEWRAGAPPEPPPAQARQREPFPDMDLVGRVDLSPRDARQGTTAIIRVWAPTAQRITASVDRRDVPLARDGDSFVGLVGFHRQASVGPRPIRFTLVDGAGKQVVRNDPGEVIQVVDGSYDTERVNVPQSSMNLLDPAKQAQEEQRLNQLFLQWRPERLWTGPWVAPLERTSITGDFGTRWSFNGGPATWAHEGTDYDVKVGDPVFAAASGMVVLAEPLHVRGNAVVIDHGRGVFTAYYHQSRIDVQAGQPVEAGRQLGLGGATGFVTGPHLHFEVRVGNVNVEPQEWLNAAPRQRDDLVALAAS